MYKIYGLIDPRDRKIFYVGRTNKPPHQRLAEHFNELSKTSLKQQRIASIKSESSEPISYVILESNILTEKQAFCKEVFWMEILIKAGAELTNATVDFDGTFFFREDTLENDFTLNKEVLDREDIYVSASHNWHSDSKMALFEPSEVLEPSEEFESVNELGFEQHLDNLFGTYFMLEYFVGENDLLSKTNMNLSTIREKRIKNIKNDRLINSGFPILEEEIRELRRRAQKNKDLAVLEKYFQRSRKSLERLLE